MKHVFVNDWNGLQNILERIPQGFRVGIMGHDFRGHDRKEHSVDGPCWCGGNTLLVPLPQEARTG